MHGPFHVAPRRFLVAEIDSRLGRLQVAAMADTHHFAPDYDSPLEYMRRTREYYLALGYDNPYRWAHYIPFETSSATLFSLARTFARLANTV